MPMTFLERPQTFKIKHYYLASTVYFFNLVFQSQYIHVLKKIQCMPLLPNGTMSAFFFLFFSNSLIFNLGVAIGTMALPLPLLTQPC